MLSKGTIYIDGSHLIFKKINFQLLSLLFDNDITLFFHNLKTAELLHLHMLTWPRDVYVILKRSKSINVF